jgi:hypothetical protein
MGCSACFLARGEIFDGHLCGRLKNLAASTHPVLICHGFLDMSPLMVCIVVARAPKGRMAGASRQVLPAAAKFISLILLLSFGRRLLKG